MISSDAGELHRLRECIRDLVALSSVRAWWVGRQPAIVAESLRDLLLSMVTADSVVVSLHDDETGQTHVASAIHPSSESASEGVIHHTKYLIGLEGALGWFTVGSARADFPTAFECLLLGVAANGVAVAIEHAALLLRHQRAERLLAERAGQQAAVAVLGMRAMSGLHVDGLFTESLEAVRTTLHVDRCEVFELEGDGVSLVLRAHEGWPPGVELLPNARIGDGALVSALLALDPLVTEDVSRDARFAQSPELSKGGVTSWISVILPGGVRPTRVLGAHTRAPRSFTQDDVNFLRAVATLLAASIERQDAESEREHLLETTRHAQAEAEKTSQVKSEFLGLMSHELRTPLNAIGGYTQLIEEGIHGPVTDEQRKDLARIRLSQRYLLGVIDNVLGFLKLGSGRVRYHVADVDVMEIMATVEDLTRPLIDAKGLRYEHRCAPGQSVLADRDKLQQIVLNLVSNAVKFTDAGGAVSVESDRDGDRVLVRVADTGCGIPDERLEYVFEPFAQVGAGGSDSAGGTGLGLTISRDFARGMGGELTVRSEPGKGSVFTVALPVAGGTLAMHEAIVTQHA
jgi:signal transduction histidine kinase